MNPSAEESYDRDKMTDKDFPKALLIHIDNLYHTRVNIFLISQGIFFAALARGEYPYRIVICVVGLAITVLIWFTIVRLDRGLKWLINEYKQLDRTKFYFSYTELGAPSGAESAGSQKRYLLERCIEPFTKLFEARPSAHTVFTWIIPSVLTIAWIALFLLTILA